MYNLLDFLFIYVTYLVSLRMPYYYVRGREGGGVDGEVVARNMVFRGVSYM